MADLNALIAQGAQFAKPVNPFEQYAQMQQLQANQMKMQEAQAAAEERNALRQLNPASPDYESQLFRVNPQLGIAYRKEAATAAAQKATQAKTEFELKAKQREFGDLMKRNLSANPSNENIIAWGQDAVLQGLYAPEVVQQEVKTLLGMPVEQRSAVLRQAGATAGELKPTVHVGPSGAFTTPAFGGPATPVAGAEGAFQMTPYQKGQLGLEQQRLGLEGRRVSLAEKVQGTEGIAPKEMQKREAAFPQQTAAIKGFEAKSDNFIRDLKALRDHPGLGQITGAIFGRTGSLSKEGSAAQALYDKVLAKGGFQALQDLREASKTGGALGNISNQEGKQLTASFAAIDRRQSAEDVKAAIDQAIGDIEGAKTRMREAYDTTYSYKSGKSATTATPKAADLSKLSDADLLKQLRGE